MRILDNYHVTKPSLSSDPTPTTPELHSSNKEAKEVEDVVDKKRDGERQRVNQLRSQHQGRQRRKQCKYNHKGIWRRHPQDEQRRRIALLQLRRYGPLGIRVPSPVKQTTATA
jgi:hypothetical protein